MQRLVPFQGWRLTLFKSIIVGSFLIFVIRMYDLMVTNHDEYQQLANENRLNEQPLPADRGVIFDRYDRPLAVNVPAYNVTIVPAALPDDENEVLRIYNRLSALVDVPPTRAVALASGQRVRSIEELVADGAGVHPYNPVVIAIDVDRHVGLQIQEERNTLPGVDVQVAAVRQYPEGELTSHIVGYMAPIPADQAEALIEQGYNPAFDRIGVDGVEFFLEDIMAGQRGRVLREVDVAGRQIGQEIQRVDSVPGENVRLTIDMDLQQAAETALRDRITLVNSTAGHVVTQSGVVIAMNPNTGEILAMVSWPGYDDSKFARSIDVNYYEQVVNDPLTPLVNHATRSLYPPGSTWKLVTALGVLQEHVVAPETTLFDPGELILPNQYAPNDPAASQRFVCWLRKGHGWLNMVGGIANSCDVYFYQVGGGNPDVSSQTLRTGGLGIDDMFRYATAVGIGSELGVELPGENAGRMPDRNWKRITQGESWSTGDTYNAAFGQGFDRVTPLQLISAVSTIASTGTLYQPTIVHDLLDAQGNVVQPFTPHVLRTVNIDGMDPSQPLTLMLLEDMIMKGSTSLACTCEADSLYYNPLRCDPNSYTNTVDIDPGPLEDPRQYKVYIPLNYSFNGDVCNPNRFDPQYTPAFVSTDNYHIVQEGMREAVLVGTSEGANLPYVHIAGKTGTAEYCDDIAWPLGLCIPGKWPAHAWFVGYGPYENPQIAVLGFVYNGGEGALVALPVVVQTLDAYFRLQNQRQQGQTGGTSPDTLQLTALPPG
jgi:penicillin-binding protein 2